jgi:MoaA/NifB/PqqE/SkfB family radical SAM enzyme
MNRPLPRLPSSALAAAKAQSPFRPFNCVWELTLACDLRCRHCGSGAGCARQDELSTLEALSLVDQLAELECELITLSGGEPTLREDWDVIGRAIADRGIRVNMVTNGVSMTPALARRAREAGLCNVAVSLDGPEAIHDGLRGAGNHRRAARGVRALVEEGLSVSIMTTLHRSNLGALAQVRREAMDLGAAMWRLQLGKPMGNLEESDTISPADLLQVIPWLAQAKREGGIHLAVGDSLGYYGPHDRTLRGWGWRGRAERWAGCQAGMQAIGIESDGGVKGCLSMQGWKEGGVDRFLEGNVRQRPLADLWFDPERFAYNRQFSPDSLEGECARCSQARLCRGGARCVAAAFTGGLGEDPYCWLSQAGEHRGNGTMRAVAQGAAAAMLLAGLQGCPFESAKGPVVVPTDIQAEAQAEVVQEVAAEVGVVDVQPAQDVCCTPEYGIAELPPPQDVAVEVPPADVKGEIDCSNVCCLCEYGVIPDDVWKECCEQVQPEVPAEPQPEVVQPEPVAEVSPPADVKGEINCDNVCCQCDYGIIPEDVWKECCEQPAEPQPEPQPEVVQPAETTPEAIDCSKVCCTCEYGVIPDEVYQECCAPCQNACCDCDYGEPPPPQCCPK